MGLVGILVLIMDHLERSYASGIYVVTAAGRTDLPVLLPLRAQAPRDAGGFQLSAWHGVALVIALFFSVALGDAAAGPAVISIPATISGNGRRSWRKGFALNIAISFLAMAIGTVVGVPLGLLQISLFCRCAHRPGW